MILGLQQGLRGLRNQQLVNAGLWGPCGSIANVSGLFVLAANCCGKESLGGGTAVKQLVNAGLWGPCGSDINVSGLFVLAENCCGKESLKGGTGVKQLVSAGLWEEHQSCYTKQTRSQVLLGHLFPTYQSPAGRATPQALDTLNHCHKRKVRSQALLGCCCYQPAGPTVQHLPATDCVIPRTLFERCIRLPQKLTRSQVLLGCRYAVV
eukprot:1158133-Pelagomonas_calceolata.AAC.6